MPDDARFRLNVDRDLSNRAVGELDDSPMAREAHERRKVALHAALDDSGIEVLDWGDTDDGDPHELVSLILTFVGGSAVSGLAYQFLADALKGAVTDAAKESLIVLTKRLIGYMRSKPKAVQDFWIEASSGLTVGVSSDVRITITFPNGEAKTFDDKGNAIN